MNGPYKIGTLSRLTGFSPALLRAWEKRFGLITPERGDGQQRVYGDDDLAVLKRVRELVDQGRSIGEIARQGRGHLLTGTERTAAAIDEKSAAAGAAEFCRRVVGGAISLNARELGGALDEAFATLGADRAVSDVIVPAEIQIGELWEADRCTVASEHMASSRFLHRLGRLLESSQPTSDTAPRVVAACFPDEHHQLGLLILAWHLARNGVRVEYLGAAMPLEDLAKACRVSQPRALLLSVMRRPAFERHHRDVRRLFADTPGRVYVGGQGVPKSARTTSTRVSFMPGLSLPESVERIVSDLGRGPGRARARA